MVHIGHELEVVLEEDREKWLERCKIGQHGNSRVFPSDSDGISDNQCYTCHKLYKTDKDGKVIG